MLRFAALHNPHESRHTRPPPPPQCVQVVVDRMFKRMIVCAGTPVIAGVLLFPLFYYLKVGLSCERVGA